MHLNSRLLTCLALLALSGFPHPASAAGHAQGPTLIASGLAGTSGSTLGPDGALYVTEGALGRITRIDLDTGVVSTFASGLPPAIVGLGGAIDVAFIGNTAYVLVTLVGTDVGGTDINGIYRIDGPTTATPIANLGAFVLANPPTTPFDVPSGLQFALDRYRNGFLVSDGHHNRVLQVTLNGTVSVFHQFDNIVPTGLAILGAHVYIAEAGPVPHLPETGKVVVRRAQSAEVTEVASGAPLLVDVEFGHARQLYVLSQGVFPVDAPPAAPALPNTGALFRVTDDGSLQEVATGLNVPTSVEFTKDFAYVVTLGGEVWRIPLD